MYKETAMPSLNHGILRDIGAIARTVQSRNDGSYRSLGLQKGQYVFLTRICENPGVNLKCLSELVRVDHTTTTKAVQKLETLGYVLRKVDGDDTRARILSPTSKALRIYERLIADENEELDRCLAGFGPRDIAAISRLLERMRENLDAARQAREPKPGSPEREGPRGKR
jgi:Transcriptional regulators